MLRSPCSVALATALLLSAGQTSAQQQRTTGPVATYWVTARTSSGLPTGGTGFNPMAMMMGGGDDATRSLYLQLEANRTSATPDAEHLPPRGLKTGTLPLVTPRIEPGTDDYESTDMRARMLIYHGCGEPTGPGQPLVVELSTDNPGEGATALAGLMEAVQQSARNPPSPGAGRTYGEWPNERTRQTVPTDGSLIGDHLVSGNYTPDIAFRLGPDQDFMPAVRLTGVSEGGSLGWSPVSGAGGYFASTMGTNEAEEMVIWTSSNVPIGFGQLPDVLSPADLARLIDRGVVLPASVTRCPVPTAVQAAAPESMLRVTAFGGEANFSHPPRPADPREDWNIEHVVKVSYTSTASTVLGLDLSEMGMDEDETDEGGPRDARQPNRNPTNAIRGILGGIIRQR